MSDYDPSKFDSSKFDDGASYLVSDDAYKQYVKGNEALGRPDDQNGNLFCAPRAEIDAAIERSNGDIHKLESELGLDKGTLGDGPIHRVDVENPSEHNLRPATGEESSANCFFNTPRDENGDLPKVVFYEETDGKNKWHARDEQGREIVDLDKSDPNEVAKLNGRYVTMYGDNVIEKCGKGRDDTGDIGKRRSFNGKSEHFRRERPAFHK